MAILQKKRTTVLIMLALTSIAMMLVLGSTSLYTPQAFAEKKSSSYDNKSHGNRYVGTDTYSNSYVDSGYNHKKNTYHNNNKHNDNGNRLIIYHDTSYLKGINIKDVDRTSPHIVKVTLTHIDKNANIPNYLSVVAVENEDNRIAGSTTISSHFTNQKTITVDLLKKNGKHVHIDNSNDVTVVVVPTKISSSILHH